MQAQKSTHMVLTLAVVCLLLLPGLLSAQVKKMSIQELTEESTAVLVGKCTGKQSAWTAGQKHITTQVAIQAEQYVKGDLGGETVITVPGGQVDDILYEVSDMPIFEQGEEMLLFVWVHPSGKKLVTGAHHGKLRIVKDKKSGARSIEGGVLEFNPDTMKELKRSQGPDEPKVHLDDFIRTIKNYVKDE